MNGTPEKPPSGSAQNVNQHTGTKKKLSQEALKKILDYNPETGVFTRKVDMGQCGAKKGDVAGWIGKNGYRQISVFNKKYYAHRLAFLWMDGYFPEHHVDHIDRVRSNNSWKNLREVSAACNVRNSGMIVTNTSGITGVCWSKCAKKWMVFIHEGNRSIYLGVFKNITDAAMARWEAEKKYNYPSCNTTSSAYLYLKEQGAL